MPQKTSPWTEAKYGWSLGESGWNDGMDENLTKFSFLFDKNLDGIVPSLPAPTTGQAYFLTSDNRIYYSLSNVWYASPTPKFFEFRLKSTSASYIFDGVGLVQISDPQTLTTDVEDLKNSSVTQADIEAYVNPRVDWRLAPQSTDPTTRVGGSPLQQGDMYYNTAIKRSKLYDGTKWTTDFYKSYVSPFDYGAVGNFVTPDDAAINAAITDAMTSRRKLVWDGDFTTSSQIVIQNANGLSIEASGTLTGRATTGQNAVLVIKNSSDVSITGRLVVSGNYNTNYACGVALYTDNATQCSNMDLFGISFAGCKNTFIFGRATEPDALISEINVYGGYSYGCPSGLIAYGTQTVVCFDHPKIITGTNGGDAAWATLPRIAIQNFGAELVFTSGEILIVDVATGLLVDNQPIGGSSIGNQYGFVHFQNCTIESASQICQFRNPSGVTSLQPGRGYFNMTACPGFHSQNIAPLIQAADDFTGKIVLRDNPISCSVTRTQPNIAVGAANCDIIVDDNSLGRGFIKGLNGVSGGRVAYSYRGILKASNTANQAFTANTQAIVKFTSVVATGDMGRFYTSYNTSTGVFTVGKEALRDAKVEILVRSSALSAKINFAVFINGSFFTGTPNISGDGVTGLYQVSIPIDDVAAGATIDIRATSDVNTTFNFGAFEYLKLNARSGQV
ncbi:MAG: putative tail protein [Myoviridae sp. ctThM1]|nr:MAG: putative tail protein [Myoviridae sp. ctThM1]